MTNDTKKRFTLRMKNETNDKLEKSAERLGLTKNAFITMVLHKEFAKKD
jgi:predicted DNA-binding protein